MFDRVLDTSLLANPKMIQSRRVIITQIPKSLSFTWLAAIKGWMSFVIKNGV